MSARKSLGQNFLLDFNLTRRIARAAGPLEGVTVVEVGPGPGGLTRALLLEGAARVVAIEKDERCLPALARHRCALSGTSRHRSPPTRGRSTMARWGFPSPARIIANLPYSVATPLLIDWLKTDPWPPWFDRMVLMFQREVAERIVAPPGGKDYGRLTVLSQWRTRPAFSSPFPAEAFTPRPKVDSALVELVPKNVLQPLCDIAALERVTAAAFGQRRKMLRAALRQIAARQRGCPRGSRHRSQGARGGRLTSRQFCRIANALAAPSGPGARARPASSARNP